MLKKSLACFLLIIFCGNNLFAQEKRKIEAVRPKLVVGLVIDQMRWDFLYRYNDLYGTNGFKRLLREGFNYENTMIPYIPTYTAPGHTCIYTGSVPAIHGIVGNNWFDKSTNKSVYCTDDSTVVSVGSNTKAGKMSPANMWTTTVTDELRLSNNFKSKVFGIALKDRGAILPAGHSANAAYWFDAEVGKWISSSHYMKQLPLYVDQFNDKDLPGKYMDKEWKTLLPIEKYTASTQDDKDYEESIPGLSTVTFPHKLSLIKKGKYESFKYTPFAATFTFDFARSVVDNEKMGAGDVTDFLTVSISSTDYTGHNFGPNSVETEDSYLRLDNDIANFLKYLDDRLGKGNYLFFLTADHGVSHIPGFLKENKISGGAFSNKALRDELNNMIEQKFAIGNAIPSVQNFQIYLDKDEINKQGKNEGEIVNAIIQFLQQKEYILNVVETAKIAAESISQPQKEYMISGYNTQRSGDLQFTVKPAFFERAEKGTSHGGWNPYDAHIPLLFFGWHVKNGKTNRETYMTDIASTIAAMLHIQMPSGAVGKVLEEIIK